MSKGVFGFGCSYTWGEGLYFYSNLDGLPFKAIHEFDGKELRPPHLLYKDKHTFINLVAENYNTWSFAGGGNGGDNIFSFKQKINSTFFDTNFHNSDIGLVIFQFTQIFRNENYDMDEQIDYIDYHLNKWESMGIKCVTISWPYEIPDSDNYKNKFKHRHVPIEFNDRIYNNFEEIIGMGDSSNITIASDFAKKGFQKNDDHLNLKGHRLIADSIIKKLEQDNFKI